MPRKRNNIPENYNAPLPMRLRELMRDTGHTQVELANYLGISRQSVSCYADGSANPTPMTIVAIARFFNVSTDWLLGLSDANSSDSNIQSVCKFTKLSEGAVKQILDLQQTEALLDDNCSVSMTELLSMILENSSFEPMMEDFQSCLDYMYRLEKEKKITTSSDRKIINSAISSLRQQVDVDFMILPDYELPNYYRTQVEIFCGQLINSIIGNYRYLIRKEREESINGESETKRN